MFTKYSYIDSGRYTDLYESIKIIKYSLIYKFVETFKNQIIVLFKHLSWVTKQWPSRTALTVKKHHYTEYVYVNLFAEP